MLTWASYYDSNRLSFVLRTALLSTVKIPILWFWSLRVVFPLNSTRLHVSTPPELNISKQPADPLPPGSWKMDHSSAIQQRKDEILAKKAKLAELKRQRELRAREFSATRQSLGGEGSDVRTPYYPDSRVHKLTCPVADRPDSQSSRESEGIRIDYLQPHWRQPTLLNRTPRSVLARPSQSTDLRSERQPAQRRPA